MPRQADPIQPQLQRGHTYTFQDPIGVRYFFNDGEVIETFGCVAGMNQFYGWYASQHQPFTHEESLKMYDRAAQCLKMEDILGEPYEYSPGYSQVVRQK